MPDFNLSEQLASLCLESSSDTTTGSYSQTSKYNKYFWVCILHFPAPSDSGREEEEDYERKCMHEYLSNLLRWEGKNLKSR